MESVIGGVGDIVPPQIEFPDLSYRIDDSLRDRFASNIASVQRDIDRSTDRIFGDMERNVEINARYRQNTNGSAAGAAKPGDTYNITINAGLETISDIPKLMDMISNLKSTALAMEGV